MDLIKPLLSWITEHANTVGLPALIFLAVVGYRFKVNYRIFYGKPEETDQLREELANDLDARIDLIKSRTFEKRYLTVLSRILDKVAHNWTKDEDALLQPSSGWTRKWFGLNPFTSNSYEFCLRIALIYPVFDFFLSWGMGSSGKISSLVVLYDQASEFYRLWTIITFIAITVSFYQARVAKTRLSHITYIGVGFAISIFSAALIIANTPTSIANVVGNTASFFLVGAFTIALSFAGISSFVAISPVIVAAAGSFAIAIAYAAADAYPMNYFTVFIIVFLVAMTSSVAVSVAGIGAIGYIKSKIAPAHREQFYWWSLTLFYLLFSSISIYLVLRYGASSQVRLILFPIFFCILPVINALIDWLSLGFTRGLLYAIKIGFHSSLKALIWALADLVLAICFLLLIATFTTSALALIDAQAFSITGAHVLDLKLLIQGLRIDPLNPDYWWLHFMMLSTLVPTLVHFLIAGMALLIILPDTWRRKMVVSLKPEAGSKYLYIPGGFRDEITPRGDYRRYAFLYVTFAPFLALAGPALLLWILYQLVSVGHGTLGRGLLDWLELVVQVVN